MANAVKQTRRLIMVRIPTGPFIMGSGFGHGEPDEMPKHRVRLKEFLIARYPVTAAEWALFLNTCGNPNDRYFTASRQTTVVFLEDRYHPRKGCLDHPANGVTWHGATRYCEWLSEISGRRFRLPTEAEWEKAARGGLDGVYYPWGNDPPKGMAQYGQVWSKPQNTLSPVGSYPPNAYGLHDMVGNIWEWCADWYDRNYYHHSPEINPKGPDIGSLKTLRGGSWGGLDVQIRCGIRVGELPDISESNVGFRVARNA